MTINDNYVRFGGIRRLYGNAAYDLLPELHIAVVGVGGVGSWAVEALARTGVGRITFIDHDDISITNMNRQLHTLSDTVDQSKVAVMADRVRQINPYCQITPIDDFLTLNNMVHYLGAGYDYVIDAIDAIKFKAAMIHYCRRNKIPIITTGGAGGLVDPTQIQVADLSRTYNDPLAARVRSTLRKQYGFTANPKRKFDVECVFSTEQPVYPKADGTVCQAKPGVHGATLDCNFGYGSATFVTANFGFIAASRAINRGLRRRLGKLVAAEEVAAPEGHGQ